MTDSQASKLTLYTGLGEAVTDRLRDAIFAGTLSDGQRLIERDLADSLGVSRGPVREALRQLALEGLVVSLPRRGSHVASVTPDDAEEIMAIRRAIEPLAVRFLRSGQLKPPYPSLHAILESIQEACRVGTPRDMVLCDLALHRELYVLSERRRLLSMWEHISKPLVHMFVLNRSLYESADEVYESHRILVETIEGGTPRAAEKAAWSHVTRFQDDLLRLVAERSAAVRDLRLPEVAK